MTPLDPAGPLRRHPLQPHQLLDRVTRTEGMIVLCHLGVPRLDLGAWTLTIDGLVRRPMCLTLAELMRRPRVTLTSVHQCCGSPLEPEQPTRRITNVVWGGVRLSTLLADCDPDSAARFVWSSGADHGVFSGVECDAYVKDLPLDRIAADVLVAYEMNGGAAAAGARVSGAAGRSRLLRHQQRQMAHPAHAGGPARQRTVHDTLVQRRAARRIWAADRRHQPGVVDRTRIGDRRAGSGSGVGTRRRGRGLGLGLGRRRRHGGRDER